MNCQTQKKTRYKEKRKEDEDKYQRISIGQGGDGRRERFERGGPNTWNEGEIHLAGSGLSEVVIIAGAEITIALTWDCGLLRHAPVHTRMRAKTQAHTRWLGHI